MDDTLQHQIDETKLELEEAKLQLSDKLGVLEDQVAQTVESASSAVSSTVEAVQGTVESVTGAVEDAVHNVSNAFDLRRQIEKHPFLIVGGAAFLGFVAAEYAKAPPRRSSRSFSSAPNMGGPLRTENVQPLPQSQLASGPSLWEGLRASAMSTLLRSLQSIATRAIPEAVGLIVGNMTRPHSGPGDRNAPQARMRSEESQRFSSSPSSERVRSSI